MTTYRIVRETTPTANPIDPPRERYGLESLYVYGGLFPWSKKTEEWVNVSGYPYTSFEDAKGMLDAIERVRKRRVEEVYRRKID